MYYPNQIVWDLDKKALHRIGDPWCFDAYPLHHTHLVDKKGFTVDGTGTPFLKTVEAYHAHQRKFLGGAHPAVLAHARYCPYLQGKE